MTRIGVQLIFGHYPEPFLEAALRSVEWADYVCAVNTDPEGVGYGVQNEQLVRRVVPRDKLRMDRVTMSRERFDFARARNMALALADDGDYVFIVDADDVHWPEAEEAMRTHVAHGDDIVTVHFYHLAVYKDMLHSTRHREILFRKTPDVRFDRGVHELLVHPRQQPVLTRGYTYIHYGYIKPPREVSARWEFYRALGAEIHEYDVTQPDRSMDDWPRVCTPYWREHPPAAREVLESYPSAPTKPKPSHPPRVGLVMLTWDDAENLQGCLASLATTEEPLELCVVDNGSNDQTRELVAAFTSGRLTDDQWISIPGLSLAKALNVGFQRFLNDAAEDIANALPPVDYIGWIHPDMTFDWPDWLGTLVAQMDANLDWVKLGAQEAHDGNRELRAGNSQCYIVRRTALEQVGLFDEGFLACGGYEDWEHNSRLLTVGKVMITPDAMVRHDAMSTRARHDNNDAARRNADLYYQKVGQWEAVV